MQSRHPDNPRTTLNTESSLEEFIIYIVTSFTSGHTILRRVRATKSMWLRQSNTNPIWNFQQYDYKVNRKPITASPDPTDPPTIELELQEAM